MVLFFVVVSAFANKQEEQANFSNRYETLAELQPHAANAILADFMAVPTVDKHQPTGIYQSGLSLFNHPYKTLADNRISQLHIIRNQREIRYQQPAIADRFYYHLLSTCAQEPPALS